MTLVVEQMTPAYPCRYVDWQHIADSGLGDEWCAALIQMKTPDIQTALSDLLNRASRDCSDADLRMSALEKDRLKSMINNGASELDAVSRQFFVYLKSSTAYQSGSFKSHSGFDILFTGPPIEGFETDDYVTHVEGAELPRRRDTAGSPSKAEPASKSVAIGIIDDGIGFAHQRFRQRCGGSRFHGIWLQQIEHAVGSCEVAVGNIFRGERLEQLNALLKDGLPDDAIYRHPAVGELDFARRRRHPMAYRLVHGVHVMDLACGSDPCHSDAVDWPIFAVQLPPAVTLDTSGQKLGPYLLQGVRTIMRWADELDRNIPLVINFSYGFSAGPKDGSHIIERMIDELVEWRNKRGAPTVVVLPSGNTYLTRTTAQVEFDRDASNSLDWRILPDDETDNFLEVYADVPPGADPELPVVSIAITPPHGGPELRTPDVPGQAQVLTNHGDACAGAYYDVVTAADGAQRQRFFLAVNRTLDRRGRIAPAASGDWRVTLSCRHGQCVKAKLYIQRDDTPAGYRKRGRQSYFVHPDAYHRDPTTGAYTRQGPSDEGHPCPITHEDTLNAIGNGETTILVGGVVRTKDYPAAPYVSSGPTETKCGPDLSFIVDESPAINGVLAAGSSSGSVVAMNGTSVAAPQATRLIACRLASRPAAHWTANGEFDPNEFVRNLICEHVSEGCASAIGPIEGYIRDQRRGFAIYSRSRPCHIPRRKY
jgi:hypothetical protein